MQSPFVRARLLTGLTQAQIAKFLGISPQVVMMNEVGVYATPNQKLLNFFGERLGEDLTDSYRTYRELSRDSAIMNQTRHLSAEFPRAPGTFDVRDTREWRDFKRQFSPSTVGFCKIIKLQPSVVSAFENSLYVRNWPMIKEWLCL